MSKKNNYVTLNETYKNVEAFNIDIAAIKSSLAGKIDLSSFGNIPITGITLAPPTVPLDLAGKIDLSAMTGKIDLSAMNMIPSQPPTPAPMTTTPAPMTTTPAPFTPAPFTTIPAPMIPVYQNVFIDLFNNMVISFMILFTSLFKQ